MVKICLLTLSILPDDSDSSSSGWTFSTEEDAEEFLDRMNYVQIRSKPNIWSGKPTRGQSTWVPVVCINEVPE